MSKRKKVFLFIAAVIPVIFILACFQNGWFYYRYYHGDRITINLTATVDGELLQSNNISAYVTSNEAFENIVRIKDNDNCVTLSVKAGEYGEYSVNTELGDSHFVFRAMQWNWWDVQNIRLHIDIDTQKNKYKTYEEYSHISEECNVINESEPEAIYGLDDINYISVGCKG